MSRSIHYCDCGEEIFDTMTKCRKCEAQGSLSPAPCSPKLLATLKEVRNLVRRIRDYDPHPSQCDHIHHHATEAIEMLEIAISENDK